MEAYRAREVRWLSLGDVFGYAVKTYSINVVPEPVDARRFQGFVPLMLGVLPTPAQADGRVGVAIAILHQGRGVDYAVLAWWDRENELPLRVFVSEGGKDDWRPARDSESICVWDLEVLWRERELYVQHVMSAAGEAGVSRYRDAVIPQALR